MEKNNLTQNLKKLQTTVDWFEAQEEVDVEKGLSKVKEAVKIIKDSKKRLKEIENEFADVKADLDNLE